MVSPEREAVNGPRERPAERRSLSNFVTTLLTGALDARQTIPTEEMWVEAFRATFEGDIR